MLGAMLCLSADLTTHAVYSFSPCTRRFKRMLRHQGIPGASSTTASHILMAAATPQERAAAAVRAGAAAPGKTGNIVTTAARIVAVAAATPQERAAAAVPALRRGADNEQWCCCQRGLQLYLLRAAWLRYWAAQWYLARAVGMHFRGCRAKRLYLNTWTHHSQQGTAAAQSQRGRNSACAVAKSAMCVSRQPLGLVHHTPSAFWDVLSPASPRHNDFCPECGVHDRTSLAVVLARAGRIFFHRRAGQRLDT